MLCQIDVSVIIMNGNYIEIILQPATKDQSEILVALLSREGYTGFEELPGKLKAFIPENEYNIIYIERIVKEFKLNSFIQNIIPEENWNASWEQSFDPIIIKDFVSIRASFHEPIAGVEHELIITPKMSFGTGHHATTWLMVEMMRDIDFTNKTVFDFGTGTGVLAILSEKLGALNVLAIDNDKWSIENAHENILANNCLKINIFESNSIDKNYRADVILANINLNVLKDNLENIKSCCGRSATILFSGLLSSDKKMFEELLIGNNFQVIRSVDKAGWCGICSFYEELDADVPFYE